MAGRRRDLRTALLYAHRLLREFRWTIFAIGAAVALGGLLYHITPQAELGGARPDPLTALLAAWMDLFAQPIFAPSSAWYLALVVGLYPLIGFILVGEGIVRFALLMSSRRRGEKEWMSVMASTYRDHVVLCGLGHLGYRVLEALLAQGQAVVAIEADADCRFLAQARATGIPILLRDMKDDDALIEAGVPHARAILIATNDDIANLEVAIDARRMNPGIRVAMRQFDQQMASKFRDAFAIDYAFSSSALSAPAVAAMALDCRVLAAFEIAGQPHVAAELAIQPGSALAGRRPVDLEQKHHARLLSVRDGGGAVVAADRSLGAGDVIELLLPADQVAAVARASRA